MNNLVKALINSYTVLIMANKKTLEEVPETYTLGGENYNLRELVEIEIAERTINILT